MAGCTWRKFLLLPKKKKNHTSNNPKAYSWGRQLPSSPYPFSVLSNPHLSLEIATITIWYPFTSFFLTIPSVFQHTLPLNTQSMETSDKKRTRKNEKFRNHPLTNLVPMFWKKKKRKKSFPWGDIFKSIYMLLDSNLVFHLNMARMLVKTPGRRKYQTD